jgi:hypothetical protein
MGKKSKNVEPRFSGFYHLSWTHDIIRDGMPVPIFTFRNDEYDPLTFHCANGDRYRPARTFDGFDFGSVPQRLQSIVSPLCASRSFAFHDSGFNNHGHWVSKKGGPWIFTRLTFEQCNAILCTTMNVEGNNLSTCYATYEAVKLGGSEIWAAHKGPFPVNPGY